MHTTNTASNLKEIIDAWKAEGLKIGFVPTMGALHEGHLSLIDIAKGASDKVVVSIFVNPTQFDREDDLTRYPRDIPRDIEKLSVAGADLIYTPATEQIYPEGPISDLKAGDTAIGLEGDFRPGHFDGVVTVVRTLFDQVQPDLAVFGQKDFQQLEVIKEMNEALLLGVEIIGAPIMRDEYGLALSSRNALLSQEELEIARKLNVILKELASEIAAHPNEADDLIPPAIERLLAAGFDNVDYLEVRWNRLLSATWLGKTRLIDNVEIEKAAL